MPCVLTHRYTDEGDDRGLTSLVICRASMRNVTIHREDEKTNAVERSIDLTNYGQVLGVRLGRTPSQYHPEKNMA